MKETEEKTDDSFFRRMTVISVRNDAGKQTTTQ